MEDVQVDLIVKSRSRSILGRASEVDGSIHLRFDDAADDAFWAEAYLSPVQILALLCGKMPQDHDGLGRLVRQAWIDWAAKQPNPKPAWLVPYDDLSEPDKEADRVIGEHVAAAVAAMLKVCPEPKE